LFNKLIELKAVNFFVQIDHDSLVGDLYGLGGHVGQIIATRRRTVLGQVGGQYRHHRMRLQAAAHLYQFDCFASR